MLSHESDIYSNPIAKHTKVDMIWVAGRSPTLVSHSLRGVAINLILGIPILPRTKGGGTPLLDHNFELIEVP